LKKIYASNVMERQFKEMRRRTNVFSCFSNIASCDRIIYAIFTHINNNWKELTFNPDFAIAKSALRAATPQLVAASGVNPAEGGLRQDLH
jgi:transposase-like protein